jgi:putative phosphoesterase
MVRKAVALFDRLGVELLIHCGDVGDIDVFDELAGRPCRFVWGNMDSPAGPVRAYLQTLGIPVPSKGGTAFEADGKWFMVFHGHEPEFGQAIQRGDADYIFHGHTHDACDERVNGVRVINPGALHRASPKTVATLDTARDEVRFHEIAPD